MREYKLIGTPKKDASTNNLTFIKHDKTNYLYDFTNLDNLKIDAYYKNTIRNYIINHTSIISRECYITIDKNAFERIAGIVYIKAINVYTKQGQRKEVIMDMSAVDLNILERKSIYDKFYDTVNVIRSKWYKENGIKEIEI